MTGRKVEPLDFQSEGCQSAACALHNAWATLADCKTNDVGKATKEHIVLRIILDRAIHGIDQAQEAMGALFLDEEDF